MPSLLDLNLRTTLALTALFAATTGLAACGGDTPSDRAAKAGAITAGSRPDGIKGMLGSDPSAGDAEGYEPEGDIVSDSGFRPDVDGFSFENYGNDVQPANLATANVQALFGDQVCIDGDGENCVLIPPAKKWMKQANEFMGGGHCMGFSVAALRMYTGNLAITDFGAEETAALEIFGNVPLQRSIAEHWVYQDLPDIRDGVIEGTPSEIVNTLAEALDSGDETYTIGISKPDYTAGHAITPFAIEDRGDGTVAILVYDNNFPGITRAIDVNLDEETWSYVGGINPKNLDEVYEGDDETQTLSLYPTSPGENVQPCPFCRSEDEGGNTGGDLGSVVDADKRTIELTLTTKGKGEHPHMVITDEEGRQTGIIDGKLRREIPGVRVAKPFGVQNWETGPEPRYQLPVGKAFNVTIDGSELTRSTQNTIDMTGAGLVVSVESLKISPGQMDELTFDGKGSGFDYETNAPSEVAPEFYAGLEDGNAAYTFAATAAGLKKGSTISLYIDRKLHAVLLDASEIKGAVDGKAYFAVGLARETPTREDLWLRDIVSLSGRKKESLAFDYKNVPAAGKPLELIVGPDEGEQRYLKAPYQR